MFSINFLCVYLCYLTPKPNRKQIVEQSRMVEEASDKVWKTSSSLFQSIDKVEKAVIHAAVDAVRDEVDTLFHENHDHSDPAKVIRKSQKIAKTRCKTVSASPEEHNTLTKYPYSHGWGIY